MKYLPYLLLLCATLVRADPADDKFLAAREAYRVGDAVRLARMTDAIRAANPAYDLTPWADYWQLHLQTAALARPGSEDPASSSTGAEIEAYIARNEGSYLGERLRIEWLKTLGRRGDWQAFLARYARLQEADQETACYAWQAQLATAANAAIPDAARDLWFVPAELPTSCMPVMDRLVADKRLSEADVRARMRAMLDVSKFADAEAAARYLPAPQLPDTRVLDRIVASPVKYLNRLPTDLGHNRASREAVLFAVLRYARKDTADAVRRWQAVEAKFPAEDRSYAWGQLARQAAREHLPEALAWYDRADGTMLSEDQQAWRVRAALRETNWREVLKAIDSMSPALAARPDWVYWRARALAATGRNEEAQGLYRMICAQPGFYGLLAAEELNLPLTLPPRAAPTTDDELAKASANPGLRRALALFRLDMRTEAVREWNWTVRGMDDRALLAAAELARRNNIFDRAISTAERTLAEHDYSLRYLAPYRDAVSPKAQALALDDSWVYGLMRQESRFVTSAKSSVGARGLMQVMPSTATLVARRIGLKGYKPHHNEDMDTNVTLGTHYLKMVLESLDNHPVLACAAYNAGPGRAQRWRGDRALEGAIYAETIPFSETRDYVKKVMANSVYYSALFEETPQTLKSRLGIVQPRKPADTIREDDASPEP